MRVHCELVQQTLIQFRTAPWNTIEMLFKCVVGRLELNIFALDPNYLLPLFLNFLVLPLYNVHLFLTPLLPQPDFFSHCLQLSPIHIIYLGCDLKK